MTDPTIPEEAREAAHRATSTDCKHQIRIGRCYPCLTVEIARAYQQKEEELERLTQLAKRLGKVEGEAKAQAALKLADELAEDLLERHSASIGAGQKHCQLCDKARRYQQERGK